MKGEGYKMLNEDYLRQQLEWVAWRIEALEQIEAKLKEMKELAISARDNLMTRDEAQGINAQLYKLQKQVTTLDEQSRVFWLDCQ